jgi:hypothetical protein
VPLETNVILKSILQNIYKSKTLADAEKAVEILLDKEDVALVREQTAEYKNRQNGTNES